MNSSAPSSWTINATPSFRKDIKRLSRDLYKSERQRQEFADFLLSLYDNLAAEGLPSEGVDADPMQGGLAPAGKQLFKIYLQPPHTRGQSGQMRILALVSREERRVELIMAYTHAEYPKQPSPREIKGRLKEAGSG